MQPDPSIAVEAVELTRRFGEFVAVDRVSFEVRTGEVFGFLGPNGAGKTTTIKMLTGLLPPSQGRAAVAGLDLRTQRSEVKRRIGYMSQMFSLYADLTVRENIQFFFRLYGVPKERRRAREEWLMDMAGLEDAPDRLVGDLPLGWKQRLALGCAVLHEPPILFLDEPTSGVDPLSRRRFWDLIYQLSAEGTTVFVTTHYMEEAEYCDRLALMNRGELIALDTPRGLRQAATDPILEVRAEDPPRAVEALLGTPGIVEAAMFGRSLHVTVNDADEGPRAIAERLSGAGLNFGTPVPVKPSLEDIFVARIRAAGGAHTE